MSSISDQRFSPEELRLHERRENQRRAMAAHIAKGLIVAWSEARPDINKLCITTLKITDTLMDCLDKTEGGNYDSIPQWQANGW